MTLNLTVNPKMKSLLKEAELHQFKQYIKPQETKELITLLNTDKFKYFNMYFWDEETQKIKTIKNSRMSYWVGEFGQSVQEEDRFVVNDKKEAIKIPTDILPSYQWPELLLALKQRIEREHNMKFNSCLVAKYCTQKAKLGYHSDANNNMGPDPYIASISLGFRRRFNVKKINGKEEVKLVLEDGDLVLMKKGCNQNYLHEVPPDGWCNDKNFRINLTFRDYPYKEDEWNVVAKPW